MNEGEETDLSYKRTTNVEERKEGNRKSPLEHHSSNLHKQDLAMDAKMSGQ